MTVSPASSPTDRARRLLTVLAATCCAVAFAPAHAQTGSDRPAAQSPIQLVPRGDTRRTTVPEVAGPAAPQKLPAPEAEPLAPVPVVPVATTDGAVEVDTLTAIDPESVGILDETGGGLPPTLWQGTDRALAIRLIEALPAPQASRTLRALTRRLLLTRATAPLGESKEPGALVTARVRKLIALGDQRGALDLVQAAPQGLMNDTLAELETQALFLDNDNAHACGKVEGHARDYSDPMWQQALAFCVALSGEHERATMIADLLRERGNPAPRAFFTLVDALGGNAEVTIDSLSEPSGLYLAMVRAANAHLPVDALTADRPVALRAIALSPNAELPIRLAAAERAAAVGALDPEVLVELYNAVPINAANLASPIESASAEWGPGARALILRAIAAQTNDASRAELLSRAGRLAVERGGGETLRAATLPALRRVQPAADLVWFAPEAAALLMAAGWDDEAERWTKLADEQAAQRIDAAAAARMLVPLAVLKQPAEDELPLDRLREWLALWPTGKIDAAAHARQAAHLFAVLEALGYDVPAELWAELLGHAGGAARRGATNAAALGLLRKSAADGRMGETVCLVLLALGSAGLDAAEPDELHAAVQALRAVGLEDAARAIGLEAVALAGPGYGRTVPGER